MNYTVRPPACSFAARTGAPRPFRHSRRCARTTVVRSPAPPVHDMSVPELTALAGGNDPHRARAVLELIGRVRTDDDATDALGELSRLRSLRDDRIFHLVSLAWAAIIGLLAAATERSWATAHAAFADLDPDDRMALLLYLESTTEVADDPGYRP